jgi:transformation/transcription domain-associated protein
MVNSLKRLGLPANRPIENRKLAVDIADLIISWDLKFLNDEKKANMDRDSKRAKVEGADSVVSSDSTFRPNITMIDLITAFLIRLGLMTCEGADTKFLSRRCLKLLKDAVEIWKGVDIKFAYIEKILEQSQDNTHVLACTLDILNTLLLHQPPEFTSSNILKIQKIMEMSFSKSQSNIRTSLRELLKKIVTTFPLWKLQLGNPPANASDVHRFDIQSDRDMMNVFHFYKQLQKTIADGLIAHEAAPQGTAEIHTYVALLSELCEAQPDFLDADLLTNTVKAVAKIAKDHIARQTPRQVPPDGTVDKSRPDVQSETMVFGFKIVRDTVQDSPDNKKLYFQVLMLLIDKSDDSDVLMAIVGTMANWITPEKEDLPNFTPKEKINFLNKMNRFERMGDVKLLNAFLDIILVLFTHSSQLR